MIWIEGNPEYEKNLRNKVGDDIVIISGIGNVNEIKKFNVANNGQSSSFLEFGTHTQEHPNIYFEKTIDIEINRMCNIINNYSINMDLYNYLSLDIQGYELEALKGFDSYLKKIDFIYCEVNEKELYVGCPKVSELDDYLTFYGFQRIATAITQHGWGDAFYQKNI
jgi:FkbM family methyltransferase